MELLVDELRAQVISDLLQINRLIAGRPPAIWCSFSWFGGKKSIGDLAF
jgi:hypothetical protein